MPVIICGPGDAVTVTNAPRFHLNVRIPGHGSDFSVGDNCSAIEIRPNGVTILDPLTEPTPTSSPMRCTYSLLITSYGWCKIEPADTPEPERTLKCEQCGDMFAAPQGLANHVRIRHPEVATEPSVRTQFRRAAEQRKVGAK